jgi:hypothetical protein
MANEYNTVFVRFCFSTFIDSDILERFTVVPSFAGYIKALVMYDIIHNIVPEKPEKRFRIKNTRGAGSARYVKTGCFSMDYEDEKRIYERLKSVPSMVQYVRALVRLDMEKEFITSDMITFFRDYRQGSGKDVERAAHFEKLFH